MTPPFGQDREMNMDRWTDEVIYEAGILAEYGYDVATPTSATEGGQS